MNNYIKMNKQGAYRGTKYLTGTILCVGGDLANRIIANGQGSKSTKEEYESKKNKNDEKELTLDYKTLTREPLEQYAISIGLEIEDIKNAKKKEDLLALVEEKLKEEEK